MALRRSAWPVVIALALGARGLSLAGQTTPRSSPDLPPISYICTMPGDEAVLESKPGICPNPKCKMTLKPVRLDTAYSCPIHPDQIQAGPGKCPIDRRELVQIAASVFWTCPDKPDEHLLEPGACGNGQPRERRFERRPHGDHNPRHGGQFFMADDNWHHLEGTYQRPGIFRVYFYDDFTRPIAAKTFSARAVVKDAADREIESVPMKLGRVSNTLEARLSGKSLAGQSLPLNVSLRVRFTPADRERPFDFAFPKFTTQPVSPTVTITRRPAPAGTPPTAAANGSASPAATGQGTPRADAFGVQVVLPNTAPELLAELTRRNTEVRALLAQGQLTAIWFPAITAKDAALALENFQTLLTDEQRAMAAAAVRRLVVAAWQIDTFGDLGDKSKVSAAADLFSTAIADINAAYASAR